MGARRHCRESEKVLPSVMTDGKANEEPMNKYRIILKGNGEYHLEAQKLERTDGLVVLSNSQEDVAIFSNSELVSVMLLKKK